MASRGITIVASHNYYSRRIRCGVSDQVIEKEEATVYVATRRGRDCKPEMLLGAVARIIRRAEEQYGWEPVDVAAVLGLRVRLITISEDCIAVMLNERVIYFQCRAERGYCTFPDAHNLAGGLALEFGTKVMEIDFSTFSGKDAFMAEHGISTEEWDAHYQDAAARWGIFHE